VILQTPVPIAKLDASTKRRKSMNTKAAAGILAKPFEA